MPDARGSAACGRGASAPGRPACPRATRRRRTPSAPSAWPITPTCSTTPAAEAYRAADRLAPADWRWSYYLVLLHLERGEAEPAGRDVASDCRGEPGLRAGMAAARRRGIQARALQGGRRGLRPRRARAGRRAGPSRRCRRRGAARFRSAPMPRWGARASRFSRARPISPGRRSKSVVARRAAVRRRASPARRHLSPPRAGARGGASSGACRGVARLQRAARSDGRRAGARVAQQRAAAQAGQRGRSGPRRRVARVPGSTRARVQRATTLTSSTRWARCCSNSSAPRRR